MSHSKNWFLAEKANRSAMRGDNIFLVLAVLIVGVVIYLDKTKSGTVPDNLIASK